MAKSNSAASYLAPLLVALSLAGCGDDEAPPVAHGAPTLGVQRVFPDLLPAFINPVAMLQAPNDGARWFVVEKDGFVRVFANDPLVTTFDTYVDIDARVTSSNANEMGLLGMAFHPNFPTDPRVYLSYTHETGGGQVVSLISEFPLGMNGRPDLAQERVLLTINQPIGETNHKGGNIAFGLDGYLYVGLGDGGGSNDGGVANLHGPIGNAQNMRTLLGKMLRIDVTPGAGYAIPNGNAFPATNPLCGATGTGPQECPEIYASGFRNPWRWSFDRQAGDLWVGDVGQGRLEEVNRVVASGNYGWRCFEGTFFTSLNCGVAPNLQPPVAEYGRTVGTTVTGGYVYRGTVIPGLIGRYVFGDFGNGRIWHIPANTAPTLTVSDGFDSTLSISSFGEGVDGELYVLDYFRGQLFRLIAL